MNDDGENKSLVREVFGDDVPEPRYGGWPDWTNSEAYEVWMASINTPHGCGMLCLSDEEAEEFNRDPDEYAAKHTGCVSKLEYLQWIYLEGTPLCAGHTKTGKRCKREVGHTQMKPAEWRALHRIAFCKQHRSPK